MIVVVTVYGELFHLAQQPKICDKECSHFFLLTQCGCLSPVMRMCGMALETVEQVPNRYRTTIYYIPYELSCLSHHKTLNSEKK